MANDSQVVTVVTKGITSLQDGSSKKCYNVFRYGRSPSATALDKGAFYTQFNNNVVAVLLLAMSSGYSLPTVTVRAEDDPGDPESENVNGGAGAVTGDYLPPDKPVVMLFDCVARGRSWHAKKFFSPIAESDTTKDEIAGAGVLTRWHNLNAAVLANLTVSGDTWRPVVFSRKWLGSGTGPLAYFAACRILVTGRTNLTLGRQKRRKGETVRG